MKAWPLKISLGILCILPPSLDARGLGHCAQRVLNFMSSAVSILIVDDYTYSFDEGLRQNMFRVNRGSKDYFVYLGDEFEAAIQSANLQGGHWIDMGAGIARAQREFIS